MVAGSQVVQWAAKYIAVLVVYGTFLLAPGPLTRDGNN